MERKNVPDFDMHEKKCQNNILEARHSARCERAPTILFAAASSYLLVIYKMLRPAAKKKIRIPMCKTIAMSKIIELKRSIFEDSDDDMT